MPYLTTTSTSKNVIQLLNERKKFENDAQVLANRVHLLRLEEQRTTKKISETQKKAMEIYLKKKEIEGYNQQVGHPILWCSLNVIYE